MIATTLQAAQSAVQRANQINSQSLLMTVANAKARNIAADLERQITELDAKTEELNAKLYDMTKAAAILGAVAEENTNNILNEITGVINKALAVLFPKDPKSITITKSMYRETHPHYNLELKTSGGVARSFNQSGTGLGQVISFLFTACLIDIKGGRKIMVMDELLNGLHPDAKKLVTALMLALSQRSVDPFQFVCVEYAMDIGKQYEIKKGILANGLSVAEEYQSTTGKGYYADQAVEEPAAEELVDEE